MNIEQYEAEHNAILEKINEIDLDACSPVMVARAEYLYTQARIVAYKIAGHYKAQQKHYEARAETNQGAGYQKIREGKDDRYEQFKTAQDAQYLSRIAKGIQLDKAAEYEGLYTTWKGIADTYESSCNALKDYIRAIEKEEGHAPVQSRPKAVI